MLDSNTTSRRSGMATVELAILLPLLLTLTFGMIEYGWMFWKAQEVNNAAREGVRAAVLPSATTAAVQTRVNGLMTSAGLGGATYTVTCSPTDVSTAAVGAEVSVTVVVQYSNVSPVAVPLIPLPATITGTATMAKEGS